MQGRIGIGLVIFSLTAVVGGYFVWRSNEPARVRRGDGARTGRTLMPSFGSINPPTRGMLGSISNESRFYASLAAKAGPAYVSFRRIAADDGTGKPVQVGGLPSGRLGPFFIHIQVLASPPNQPGRQIKLLPESIKATDDNHHAILHTPSRADGEWAIDGGMVYQFRMEAPSDGAKALSSVESTVEVKKDGQSRKYPCSLSNIPLPSSIRMFGRAAPRIFEPGAATSLPPGAALITGDRVDKLVASTNAIPVLSSLGTQRLLVGDGLPVRVGVPSPDGPASVGITAVAAKFGAVDLEFSTGGARLKTRSWDNEPVLLALPKSNITPRLALVVRLGRDVQVPDLVNGPPVFTAESGKPGGAIESGVKVGTRPFGRGYLTVMLSRKGKEGWSEPRRATVALNSSGAFSLPNMAPGEYRIERPITGLYPYVPDGAQQGSVEEYMLERFGAAGGKWAGDISQSVTIRAGETTTLAPLQFNTSGSMSARNPNL